MNKQHNNDYIKKLKQSIIKNKPNHNSLKKKIKKNNIFQKVNINKENVSPLTSRKDNKYKNHIYLSPMKNNLFFNNKQKKKDSNSILFQLKNLRSSSIGKKNEEKKYFCKYNFEKKIQKKKISVIKSSLLNKSTCFGNSELYTNNTTYTSNYKNNSFHENNLELSSILNNNSSYDEKKNKQNYENSLSHSCNKSHSVILYKNDSSVKKKNNLKSLYLYEKNASNLSLSKKNYKGYIYNKTKIKKNNTSQDENSNINYTNNNTKDKTFNKNLSSNSSNSNMDLNEINNEEIHFAFVHLHQKKNKFYTKLESKDKIENDEEIIIINIL